MNCNNQILLKLSNGDIVRRYYKGLIIDFAGARRVSSTSVLNGGVRDDLQHIFNYNCLADEMVCSLHEDSYVNELAANAASLGLNPKLSSGLSTAAWMENASIKQETYKELTVTAVITAGIDSNGTRVGDPGFFYEDDGDFQSLEPGTINILLHINKTLLPGVINRAMMTCSKAACIACEELMLGSQYSCGLATGSGTDGIIVVSNLGDAYELTNAGEHSKLGEMIANVVIAGVKEALYKQTGAGPARAHTILQRGKRYGITSGTLWDYFINNEALFEGHSIDKASLTISRFEKLLDKYNIDSKRVVWTSLYCHILDQYRYGLIEWAECYRETRHLSIHLWQDLGLAEEFVFKTDIDKDIISDLLDQMKYTLIVAIIKGNNY